MDFFEWTLIFVVIWMKVQPSHSNARFCMANQMTIYGTIASTTSATSSQDCAYQTWEAANLGFGWDGSSQCQMFSAITGYLEQADSTYTYYIQDDSYSGTACMAADSMISLIHTLVYDGNTCPTSFTFDPSEQVCQSTMSETDCTQYSAAWAYPYMAAASNPCALYPSTQTTYPSDYYCNNYFATIQIFQGSAYCFSNFTLDSSQSSNKRIISNDGCNFVFDADSHTIIPGSKTEVDWLYANYGQVMIGAYLSGTLNLNANYYFYDNSSASSFITGTLNPLSGGFLYTDGSQVTSATSIPNNILMCKMAALALSC